MRAVAIVAGVALCAGACKPSQPSSKKTRAPVEAPAVDDVASTNVVTQNTNSTVEALRRESRVAFDKGDLAEALRALDRAVTIADDATELKCERAALLSRRAVSETEPRIKERTLRTALADCPTEDKLTQGLADTLILRARDSEGSARIALLKESTALHKTPVAYVDLAQALEKDDDIIGATAAAAEALALSPEHEGIKALHARLSRHGAVEGTFKSAKHSHFVARFEGYGEERLAWGALDTLEQAWFSVGKALDLYPRDAITVVIYTGEQYKQATAGPDWSTGLFDGKIRIREGQLAADKGSLDDTLIHEYTHAVLHTLPVPVPAWFNEGLAQHFESRRQKPTAAHFRQVGVASRGAMDGASFTRLPADVVPAAYVMAHAMVERLIERRGVWGLNQLVAELKQGRPFAEALQRSFAIDADTLYRDVTDSFKQ